ncbi:MAG: efflux RND transporter permease subunit [Gammaproteobacteria bacterium]|nr:efflux RND transporter permease subunit [Gammaproteobacteria bacterium]
MSLATSVATLATRRPVAITVLAVAIALVGYLAWQQIPVDLLPDLQSPTVAVSIRSGDRPPTEMERIYGEQLEQRLFTVRGIREISQVARTGQLVATVIFDWDTNLELGLVDVQKAVGPMAADPAVDEVLVRRFDPRQAPVLTFGLTAPSGQPDLAELRRLARRQVAPGLEQLTGVAEVWVTGGREKEVRVTLDPYRLEAFNITLATVEKRLIDENVDISAGTLEEGSEVYLVRGMARFRRAEDIRRVVVQHITASDGGRQAIRISDVGTVELVDREIDHLVRVNGIEGVGLAIYKEAGANTVEVSKTVRAAMAGLAEDLPGVRLTEVSDDAALIVDALADLQSAAGLGLILAVVVLAVFLRSAGATLVIAAAVPVSILATLFLMRFGSQSLNIVTLAGLALGAGMLVDNAIVVVESIYRRLAEGESPETAAATGTGQVAGAITASTLTTCVVFLPVLFVEGLAARLIEGIAFTVVVSLLASLGVAMLLIPALARWFMPAQKHTDFTPPRYRRNLEALVRSLLRRPSLTVLAAIILAGLSSWGLVGLGTELLPAADPRQFSLRIIGHPGQRVESTARVVEGIESLLEQAGDGSLRAVLSEVGRLPEDSRMVRTELTEEHTARITVRVAPSGPTGRQFASRLAPILDSMETMEVNWEVGSSALSSALGTSGPAIVVEVSGQSLLDLRRGAELIKAGLEQQKELWNVRTSFEGGPPELRIVLNRAMADGLGVDLETLSRVLEASLDGRVVTMLSTGDEDRPITIRLTTPTREDLKNVVFLTAQGQKVAVGEVASFVEAEGAREIFRRDQRRTAMVTAHIAEGADYPSAIAAVVDTLDVVQLPPGLRAQFRGEEAERARTFGELQLAAIFSLVLVFMVLSGSFESLIHPVTVLAAIPLGLIGVALMLVPLGQPIGVMAMLGLIVLAGVAVNDAVLLLSTARQLIASGTERVDALVSAAGIRLRPILMTTLTTVLVLLPLVFGSGEGAELRAPMALTIIGGITLSTLGSLVVLPCLYLVLDRLRPGEGKGPTAQDDTRGAQP